MGVGGWVGVRVKGSEDDGEPNLHGGLDEWEQSGWTVTASYVISAAISSDPAGTARSARLAREESRRPA